MRIGDPRTGPRQTWVAVAALAAALLGIAVVAVATGTTPGSRQPAAPEAVARTSAPATPILTPAPSPSTLLAGAQPALPTTAPGTASLFALSGSGRRSSRPITLPATSPLDIDYSFDCTSVGPNASFVLYLDDASTGTPVDLLVGDFGLGGKGRAKPAPGPGRFTIRVDSPCRWALEIGRADGSGR